MVKLKFLIVLAFGIVFAAGWIGGTATERRHAFASAQNSRPATRPSHADGAWLKGQLNLTPDQDAAIKAIWAPLTGARGKYMDQWQQINRDRDESVRALLSSEQKAAVDSIYREAEAEQTELESRRDKEYKDAVAKTMDLLSPDQQKKYTNLLAHQHGDHNRLRAMPPSTRPAH